MVEANIKTNGQTSTSSNKIKITIAKDSMTATVVVRHPSVGELPSSVNDVLQEIANAEVVFGIDETAIEKIINDQIFNQPVKIASGRKPTRGKSAQFIYSFDTTSDHKPLEDEKGNIDYKNINFIQNVGDGELLVTKIPPTQGDVGITVRGKEMQGPDGRDVPFKCGANTSISKDGLELTATCAGAIVFTHGKVSVNDITIISGDVDFNVGNIDSRGSVRINGGIKAGFTIKTDGDVEVAGNVEDCMIYSKGNIMIKGGIIGQGEGEINAEGDISFKFAEGMRINSNSSIYVGDEIVNCQLTAGNEIIVKSKNGKVVGGDIRAKKFIKAARFGSDAGTATMIRVAHDSKLMKKYFDTHKEINRLNEDELRIKEALNGLYRLQLDKQLSEEQEAVLAKFEEFKRELPTTLENLENEKTQIEAAMKELLDARIVAEEIMYTGVKAYFGIVYLEIVDDRRNCELSSDGNRVLVSAYQKDK